MKPVIQIQNLSKSYRTSFLCKKIEALKSLSLDLYEGEILGFIGPNGAGKTTTFKLLLGLVSPDSGLIEVFGQTSTDYKIRKHIGYLPETPYFYPYLTTLESLDLYGRMFEMTKRERGKRIDELLAQVGLEYARNRQVKKFSRGMMQRLGIAQALINDPKLLILDEPMSGLDPMGRKEMRDIIMGCRKAGKSVIFSTHILSDAEMICDKVAIVSKGKLQYAGEIRDITTKEGKNWEVIFTDADEELVEKFTQHHPVTKFHKKIMVLFSSEKEAREGIVEVEKWGGKLISYAPRSNSLEELFMTTSTEND